MNRWLGCVLLLGTSLDAQDMHATLLALKNSSTPRKALSNQLVEEMMTLAKPRQTPSRASVQRFTEDLTVALMGRDITNVRANALEKALSDLMRGKGSTFVPASTLRETLTSCGVEERTVQMIVKRFIEIGQEVRGPDDLPMQQKPLKLR